MAKSTFLSVQCVAGQGFAAPGNREPADFLVVVKDWVTGAVVSDLVEGGIDIVSHFSLPGATCGFTNNITAFTNLLDGAYRIQVKPKGCNWVQGDYLAQIKVAFTETFIGDSERAPDVRKRLGQTVATLSIKS